MSGVYSIYYTMDIVNPFDSFDRGTGNGSRNQTDDWLDDQSIFDNEWGSSAATTFKPSDTDGKGNTLAQEKQEKFQQLYKLHNGKMERDREKDIRHSHIRNDTKTFISVLEMPNIQQEEVLEIVEELDISSNNFGSYKYEKIILAVCSLVADRHLGKQPNPSLDERLFLTDSFRELMDVTKCSSSELRDLRESVRQKSAYF